MAVANNVKTSWYSVLTGRKVHETRPSITSLELTSTVPGYVASTLDFYEEYTDDVVSTGAWTDTYTLSIVRNGKLCSLMFTGNATDHTASETLLSIAVPFRFRPNDTIYCKVPGKDRGSVIELAAMISSNSGAETCSIDIGVAAVDGRLWSFSAAAGAFVRNFAFSYPVPV